MTAPWPPADLPGIRIDLRARPPTADARCRCGWADAATGSPAAIAALGHRWAEHRAACRGPESP